MATGADVSDWQSPPATSAIERLKHLQLRTRNLSRPFRMSATPTYLRRGRLYQKTRASPPISPTLTPPAPETTAKAASSSQPIGLTEYPPYLIVPGIGQPRHKYPSVTELVQGATCRMVVQLLGEGKSWRETADHVDRTCLDPDQRLRLGLSDVRAILKQCQRLGLTACTALECDEWDNTEVERWWIKEDRRHCDKPVTKEECGSDGWWTKIESIRHRDWARWPSPDIGPERFDTNEDF